MKITVFTPTYNRGYIIENLYKSLQKQTYKNFEWLVIDDGSIDNTENLFETWLKTNNTFQIRYFKVKNGGKHRAINRATELANGELFFIVDSDDQITYDALENIVSWENNIKEKELFCGVAGNKGKTSKEMFGTSFDGDFIDATSLERNSLNITGDKAEVFYTRVLKQYKFPEFDGENFVTEAVLWDKMARDGYKIRWFNTTIYLCDYLEDGLTRNMQDIFAKNPRGTAYYINQQINFYNCNTKGRLSYYNLYYEHVKSRVSITSAANYLGTSSKYLKFARLLFNCKKQITAMKKIKLSN